MIIWQEETRKEEIILEPSEDEAVVLPRKQKFRSLEQVVDEANFDHIPRQADNTFQYSDAAGRLQITWNTNKANGNGDAFVRRRGRAPRQNIIQAVGGPNPRSALQINELLDAFHLFITEEMIRKIVDRTNASIETFHESLQVSDENRKNLHTVVKRTKRN